MPFLTIAWGFLRAIPWQAYAVIGAIAVVAGVHFKLVHDAVVKNDKKWEVKISEEREAYAKQVAALKTKQAEVVTRTVIEYRDRLKVVKEAGNVVIKEIEKLVPVDTCVLPGGVRSAHDFAADNNVPSDSERIASAASEVEARTLIGTVAENYQICHAEFAKLIALQRLVHSLQEIKP